MYTRVYWLPSAYGKLGIAARPRGGEWLENEIQNFSIRGIQHVVSLLEDREINLLQLGETAQLCQAFEIQYHHFPIPDRSVAASKRDFLACAQQLNEFLKINQTVLIHCRMGIGRSSLLAASLLVEQGTPIKQVFELITKARGLTVPDTAEQREWLTTLYT